LPNVSAKFRDCLTGAAPSSRQLKRGSEAIWLLGEEKDLMQALFPHATIGGCSMSMMMRTMLVTAGVLIATQAAAQVTFYEREDFRGRSVTIDHPVGDMDRRDFDDRASSAIVQSGDWQVCEDPGFRGRCTVLHPGEYRSLREVGLNNDISSVRPTGGPPPGYGSNRDDRYAVAQSDQYQRRGDERVFEVPVTSVHAVVGPPEQRCWVERQDVVTDRSGPNIGGAIAGAVIGGVLGHQIGSGRGRDVATAVAQ
jgi:hypothetical protein